MTVEVGQPLLFIDLEKKSMGFNDLPKGEREFWVNGKIILGSNRWNNAGGAIDMGNSDIVKVNSIYYNDAADSNSEGTMWLKTGKTSGSLDNADYDNFKILDGMAYINGKPVLTDTQTQLWSGGVYMLDFQTIYPTKRLANCPNGWLLVWSEHNVATATSINAGWQYAFVSKLHPSISTGGIWITLTGTGGVPVHKYLLVYDDRITGDERNNDGNNTTLVLRFVHAF